MQPLVEADSTAFLHFIYMGRLPADPGINCMGMYNIGALMIFNRALGLIIL